MSDGETLQIIEQITLRNLVYARKFLASHKQACSGNREKVRERLIKVLKQKPHLKINLRSLLEELDAWGAQRIRLGTLPQSVLADFASERSVRKKSADAGMSDLLDGSITLVPPLTMTPMAITYKENGEGRLLTLIAAKTRNLLQSVPSVPDITLDNYPGVVFKPFKEETQKAVYFAEINLNSGFAIISSTLVKAGFTFNGEFGEFYTAFKPLIPLDKAVQIELFNATRNIRQKLDPQEVRIRARRARTSVGGTIGMTSHKAKSDMRADPELLQTDIDLSHAPCAHCNCYWEPKNGLQETVHTHVLAPEGEISIMGQVLEQSVRYVLRRILAVN